MALLDRLSRLAGYIIGKLPIKRAILYYLRNTGRYYLIPFIEGLNNIGRPSENFFPPELLEQALALILSGLNNTMVIQSNLHWVWPYWIVRQQDPDAEEYVPTGVNIITGNLSNRNWTSLGLYGSSNECMVDPVGMVTLFSFSWSVLPYLIIGERNFVPPLISRDVTQELHCGTIPSLITRYENIPDIGWSSQVDVVEAEGEELAVISNTVRNISNKTVSLTFGLSIRPYNPLTIGHINKLKYKNRLWRVNGKPGLLLIEEPARMRTSNRFHEDPILTPSVNIEDWYRKSKSGIIAGACEYEMTIPPGGERQVYAIGIIGKRRSGQNNKFVRIDRDVIEEAVAANRGAWLSHQSYGMTISIPDKELERAFCAVKNHLPVFDDGDYFTSGSFFYHTFWIRDGSFIANSFDILGFGERVLRKIDFFMRLQCRNGGFMSHYGEWDSTGQVIFTAVNHARRNGDSALLRRIYPSLLRGAKWIDSARLSTKETNRRHFGLLPAGISAEHFGPNDHYFWDNFWAVAGIKALIWAAGRLDYDRDAAYLCGILDNYLDNLNAVMNDTIRRRGGGTMLPCSPYRVMDSAAIGNLVAIAPLDILDMSERWLLPTLDYLWENNVRDGLFYQKIIHTGLNVYLTLQLAKTLLVLDDERWSESLYAVMEYATPTYTWPEAINPRTRGGCMGDGDHGWAAAEFINFVRDMFVCERSGEMILGLGLYEEWFKEEMDIKINNATTLYGLLSYTIHDGADCMSVSWSLIPNSLSDRVDIYLLLPAGLTDAIGLRYSKRKIKTPLHGDTGKLCFKRRVQQVYNSTNYLIEEQGFDLYMPKGGILPLCQISGER